MGAGLTLVLTSPRVAESLLSWPAWAALRSADIVLGRDLSEARSEALQDAGVVVSQPISPEPRELARELVDRAVDHEVVWFGSPDGDPGLTDALAGELSRVAVDRDPPPVEVLVGSHDVPGARLLDLVAVMDRLRSPGGCPWDAEQNHASLAPYLIEESYELTEAIDSGDRTAMQEELGDVLLQVAFHARVAEEHPTEPFDIDDVAAGIVAKLVRRHPHVFGGSSDGVPGEGVRTADQVEANWDRIKAVEKGRESVLDGIPLALPALARADAVLRRLARTGQDGGEAAEQGWAPELVGERLLDAVRQARAAGVDAESALREAVRRLEQDARAAEVLARNDVRTDVRTDVRDGAVTAGTDGSSREDGDA